MTQQPFDQFKNKILQLSQDAEVIWDKFNELKTSKDMVVHLARKQKRQLDLTMEELQKANEEIRVIKFALNEAHEKIKGLENKKIEAIKPVAKKKDFSVSDTIDLEMMAQDVETKLAKKEEEETFNYMKKMDMGL